MINFPAIVILLVGIIIRFKTAYYQEGVLISDPKKVRNNYLKGPFFVDVASIFVICVYEFAEVLSQHDKPVSYRFIVALFYLKIG